MASGVAALVGTSMAVYGCMHLLMPQTWRALREQYGTMHKQPVPSGVAGALLMGAGMRATRSCLCWAVPQLATAGHAHTGCVVAGMLVGGGVYTHLEHRLYWLVRRARMRMRRYRMNLGFLEVSPPVSVAAGLCLVGLSFGMSGTHSATRMSAPVAGVLIGALQFPKAVLFHSSLGHLSSRTFVPFDLAEQVCVCL